MNVSGERVRIGGLGRLLLRWYDAERRLMLWPFYLGFPCDSMVGKAWGWLIGWPMVVELVKPYAFERCRVCAAVRGDVCGMGCND